MTWRIAIAALTGALSLTSGVVRLHAGKSGFLVLAPLLTGALLLTAAFLMWRGAPAGPKAPSP